MYAIEFTKAAAKAFASMPRNLREVMKSKIESLAADPMGAQNVKKLIGRDGYRLRVGDWRVIYTLDNGRLIVRVLDIGTRGGVYE